MEVLSFNIFPCGKRRVAVSFTDFGTGGAEREDVVVGWAGHEDICHSHGLERGVDDLDSVRQSFDAGRESCLFQHTAQFLPALAHERFAQEVLILTRRFTDDEEGRGGWTGRFTGH
jgi:hypothetical protein